ncbi:MAG TPA: solute:sodium symporter family transporter [Ignavibacteriaceae bacterium]|nr:solute:sodium symporter family transporter [Ignavibacteriaceae bacterium]
MELHIIDISIFLTFFIIVVGISMYKSRKEETGEDFFLASRGLIWPMIGLSLIAANISTEQFVGMSGQSAGNTGLAIASYEWMAAITLIIVAFLFLPRFLRSGIYTIPEYLEYRYNTSARSIMAFYTMIIYVGVTLAAVLYSGGITIYTIFNVDLTTSIWAIGILAALYTTWGGLKAVAWADLFQGSALIIGGFIVLIFSTIAVGGFDNFFAHNQEKLHMILPSDHPVLPWTALVIGLWIPNIYYWGLNQYIVQRTLAAKSLKEGQYGIIFAAILKLIIPFIIVFPGIMAAQLYGSTMKNTDAAYPLLIKNLIPIGFKGFMLAAIAGAVISTLASLLNSASTIFSIDIYSRYINKKPTSKNIVLVGRLVTVIFVLIGCLIAPQLGNPKFMGIFTYIQEFQGYISPGILAAFVFGILFKKAPASAGVAALLVCVPVYGFLQLFFGEIAFLNRMAITFVIILLIMTLITLFNPLREPKVLPVRKDFDMTPQPKVLWLGISIVVVTLILYGIFW